MKQLLILSLTAISFLSCSNDDASFTETSIFGTWKVIAIKTGNDVIPPSSPSTWETIENGYEVTYNENYTFYYNNDLFCSTQETPSNFIIEIDENESIIRKDYNCSGNIEILEDEWATFYFDGKYLIESTLYSSEVSTSFKYIKVKESDSRE